jgi:hypothetical protein
MVRAAHKLRSSVPIAVAIPESRVGSNRPPDDPLVEDKRAVASSFVPIAVAIRILSTSSLRVGLASPRQFLVGTGASLADAR